ncbi:transposase [Oleidesulfovibrio alaskensis]|uniref:transposase n=1 Tax=Oleidesulfovibrio alaskensis TaxID=58180 RepID=UPI0023523F0F|nr:transposase [Oleidesulfovibrio alaskensis]
MSSPKRRTYDSEFKQNAVLLTEDPSRTVTEVAESLGVAKDLLYRWRREFAAQCQRQCKNDPPRQLKIDPPWKN